MRSFPGELRTAILDFAGRLARWPGAHKLIACPHCGERTNVFGQGGGEQAAQTLGVPLLGQIPLMPELREGGDAGTPIVVSQPDSAAGSALIEAARQLAKESRTLVRKPLGLTVAPKG